MRDWDLFWIFHSSKRAIERVNFFYVTFQMNICRAVKFWIVTYENICSAGQYSFVFHDIHRCKRIKFWSNIIPSSYCWLNVSKLWHQKEFESRRILLLKIWTSCSRLRNISSVRTYVPCHTIHHVTGDIMIQDMMAPNTISSAMDVDEFPTLLIKFSRLFMVDELHEFEGVYRSLTTTPTISLRK